MCEFSIAMLDYRGYVEKNMAISNLMFEDYVPFLNLGYA